MLNKIILMGRLCANPELRRTGSGTAVTSFSLACDRDFKSQSGDKETDFIEVVAWKNTAEFVSKYFSKGKEIIVQGEMQSRKWQDKDGNNRISWEIQNAHAEFCGSKSDNSSTSETVSDFPVLNDSDDSLPF